MKLSEYIRRKRALLDGSMYAPLWTTHLELEEPCTSDSEGMAITKEKLERYLDTREKVEPIALCNNKLCRNPNHWSFVPKGLKQRALREAALGRVVRAFEADPTTPVKELALLARVTPRLVRALLAESGLKAPMGADGKVYPKTHELARLRRLLSALQASTRHLHGTTAEQAETLTTSLKTLLVRLEEESHSTTNE